MKIATTTKNSGDWQKSLQQHPIVTTSRMYLVYCRRPSGILNIVEYEVIDSNSRGSSVIVYARLNGVVVAILTDKETLLLSFSPENKYSRR